MAHWDDLIEVAEAFLQSIDAQYACLVDCIWDSQEEFQALCKCYKRYDENLLCAVKQTGLLNELGTFQTFSFYSLGDAIAFCKATPKGMPHISVWDHFTFVTDNSGNES